MELIRRDCASRPGPATSNCRGRPYSGETLRGLPRRLFEVPHQLPKGGLEGVQLFPAEMTGPVFPQGEDRSAGGFFHGLALRSRADEACPAVVSVRHALQVAVRLKEVDEIAHRLLGHLGLFGQLRQVEARPQGKMLKHGEVGEGEVLEAGCKKVTVDTLNNGLSRDTQKSAEHASRGSCVIFISYNLLHKSSVSLTIMK